MSISIKSYFYPFRLDLRDKKPVQLSIELVNRYEQPKRISLEVITPRNLTLDKEMKKTGELKRIDKILPKERKAFEFEIHAKPFIKPGEHSIGIKVMEHFDDYIDYKYVAKSYTKIVDLTVK